MSNVIAHIRNEVQYAVHVTKTRGGFMFLPRLTRLMISYPGRFRRRLRVSEPTVMRFLRKVGYDYYQILPGQHCPGTGGRQE
jgi:hypothetical protein